MSTNEELVIRIQNGEDVMMELYEQVRQLLRSVCWKYRGYADMEDLTQEAVLALYDAVDGYDPERGNSFSTYLMKCVRNHIIRYLPGHPQEASLDEPINDDGITLGDILPAPEQDIEGDLDAEQLKEDLWAAVDDLEDRSAKIIKGYFKDGKSFRFIADELDCSYDTVLRLRQKGLRDLKHSRRLRPYREELSEIYGCGLRGNGVNRFQRTWTSSTEQTAIRLAERTR